MSWRQYCIVSHSATAFSCTAVVVCMYGLAPGVALMTCCLSVLDTGQIASIIGTALPTSSNFFINYAIVQVRWESLMFITAVVARFYVMLADSLLVVHPYIHGVQYYKMFIALCRLSLLWYVLTSSQDASLLSVHLMHIVIMHS
jgi:hypothetical protein